jgi:hypothetical protein
VAKDGAGKTAADAIKWVAEGGRAPESIAGLSTSDQVKLAQAGGKVVKAVKDAAKRAES